MPKIVILEKEVVDKIAAGEVVERPASVVKELVENAIDAGATRVEVELEEGGKRRIVVADNGCGMALEDAVLALERHATSKIRTADDLLSVHTLGFRGEALPSIAAVSELCLLTRAEGQETGVELWVERGQISSVHERGAPVGTRVTVMNLFANVPARLKFLKTPQTEVAHILDLMVRFALAYPHIHFRLVHNKHPLFASPGSGDLLSTIVAAFGREVARAMIPVASAEGGPVSVRGYVSHPSLTRSTRSHHAFFVNQRLVRSPILTRALDEAYKGLIPAGRFPVACLFLTVAPGAVDVNVHPAKMEVRFADERLVFNLTCATVRTALEGMDLVLPAFPPPPRDEHPIIVAQSATSDPFAPTASQLRPPTSKQPFGDNGNAHREETWEASSLPDLRPIACVLGTYILAEATGALYIIDQHAAHERILYDALLRRSTEDIAPQPLLLPQTLTLSHSDALLLEQYREVLAELGFQIEPFGRNAYLLRSVPTILVGRNYAQVLQDVLDDLRETERTGRLMDIRREVCASLACHSVTRSGESLSPEEMQRLVQYLRQSPAPHTCPHGRPTLLVLTQADLEKRIGR